MPSYYYTYTTPSTSVDNIQKQKEFDAWFESWKKYHQETAKKKEINFHVQVKPTRKHIEL